MKDASKTFWDKVQSRFTSDSSKYGFRQSLIDPCLFIREDFFLLTYVDNILCFARDKKMLDQVVKDMETDFKITDEGEVTKYLGVDINRKSDDEIERQPYLIERVFEDMVKENIYDNEGSTHCPK